jgi:hypothetical protein
MSWRLYLFNWCQILYRIRIISFLNDWKMDQWSCQGQNIFVCEIQFEPKFNFFNRKLLKLWDFSWVSFGNLCFHRIFSFNTLCWMCSMCELTLFSYSHLNICDDVSASFLRSLCFIFIGASSLLCWLFLWVWFFSYNISLIIFPFHMTFQKSHQYATASSIIFHLAHFRLLPF